MFYCDTCARVHRWPESLSRSQGRCEICGRTAVCNDTPSSRLPSSPNYGRQPLTLVVAPSHQYFVSWCRVDCDPPENPDDAKFVKFFGPGRPVMGRHRIPGDLLYILGDPLWRHVEEVLHALMPCGYTEYLNDDGMPLQVQDLIDARRVSSIDPEERSAIFGRLPGHMLRVPSPLTFSEIAAELPPGCHLEGLNDPTGGPPVIVIDTTLVSSDQIRSIRERFGTREHADNPYISRDWLNRQQVEFEIGNTSPEALRILFGITPEDEGDEQ